MKISSHYILAILLSLLLPGVWKLEEVFPNMGWGWHLLTFAYSIILIAQITFYVLTTNFRIGLTIISFIFNFMLWTFEQVALEAYFNDTWFYQQYGIQSILLGATLWATNKLILDQLLTNGMRVNISSSVLDKLINRFRFSHNG